MFSIAVSTEDQAREGYSLEAQEQKIRQHLEMYKQECDYEIYDVYTDAGISGKDIEHRTDFKRLLKDMKTKKFNMVMALKLDRISRDIIDFLTFMNDAKNCGCNVEFLLDKVDTSTASGRMIMNVLSVFAQFERELIRERTITGVESAINKGHYGGKPPLGYKKVEGGKRWEIDEDTAHIVREIFDMCLNGKTYSQMTKILLEKYANIEAVSRIDKKTGKKKIIYRKWDEGSLSVILTNKKYIGIYEHGKYDKNRDIEEKVGFITPLVSDEDFYKCQENIKRNRRNYYRSKHYLYGQKVRCHNCNIIMACNSGKEYLYYKCKNCNEYIREEDITKVVIDKLTDLLELYFAIEGTYFAIDSDLAEDFNNCKIDNKIRFAIDSNIINEKVNFAEKSEVLSTIWDLADYETKSKFVMEYIDIIEVEKGEKIKGGFGRSYVDLVELKLKADKIRKLFDLKEKNMTDTVAEYNGFRCSKTEFKSEKEANKYIELLEKKHNFVVIDIDKNKDYYINNDLLFKVIDIKSNRAVEKDKTLFLELVGEDEEIEQEILT